MPGCDFYSLEDSRRVDQRLRIESWNQEHPNPVVVCVRGYRTTIRSELERRIRREEREAEKLGLVRIGEYEMPVKWPISRPVFQAPSGMVRRDFKVVSPSILLQKWTGGYVTIRKED